MKESVSAVSCTVNCFYQRASLWHLEVHVLVKNQRLQWLTGEEGPQCEAWNEVLQQSTWKGVPQCGVWNEVLQQSTWKGGPQCGVWNEVLQKSTWNEWVMWNAIEISCHIILVACDL